MAGRQARWRLGQAAGVHARGGGGLGGSSEQLCSGLRGRLAQQGPGMQLVWPPQQSAWHWLENWRPEQQTGEKTAGQMQPTALQGASPLAGHSPGMQLPSFIPLQSAWHWLKNWRLPQHTGA